MGTCGILFDEMAKIKHNNYIDTVVKISQSGAEKGIFRLYAEGEEFSGRYITIDGNNLFHFATTGYLGLEQDPRIKQAAVDAILNYGTQFPLSKTFISHHSYGDLENKLQKMYNNYVVVTKNSTLGHMGVIPTIIRDEDAVILDQQVHWSVQTSCQLVKVRDVPVEMVRHNDMAMLEEKILELNQKGGKIWYFADGIYSMFGDLAPIEKLKELCRKYPQLHLYFDDVHGMSWTGKHGTGFVLSQYEELPKNVVVFTTLSKTFGASGATLITSDKDLYTRVKSFGGPLTFSAQLEPSSVAAASASADIHLSDEIYELQKDLAEKVNYCNELLSNTDLPLVEVNNCPVFYLGTGAPSVGYNLVKKLMNAGFYVNMGVFPAVAVKKTGVRFTISRHNQKEDIKALVEALVKWYPIAIKEEKYTNNQIRRIFGLPEIKEEIPQAKKITADLKIELFKSCEELDKDEWNSIFSGRNVFDYDGLVYLESAFKNQLDPINRWRFKYLLIKDDDGKVVLATFFTLALWKDDMLAPAKVSELMEQKRKQDPLFHTSRVLVMGSMFTEGDHLFIDSEHPLAKTVIDRFFQTVNQLDEELEPEVIALRDFRLDDQMLSQVCNGQGYVQAELPESCVFVDLNWDGEKAYLNLLSSKSRKHFRQDILPYRDRLRFETTKTLNEVELDEAYELYLNVWEKNFDLNTFAYSKSVFKQMISHEKWEFIKAKDPKSDELVAVMFCYRNSNITYVPSLIGLNYHYTLEFSVYRQMLYQTILRAKSENFSRIDFGLSASFEKKKIGAQVTPKIAYIQAKDNFSMEMMEVVQNGRKVS